MRTGKALGGDIVEGKRTFLWLWAYAEASPEVRALMEAPERAQERREVVLKLYYEPAFAERAKAFLEARFAEVREAFLALPHGEILWESVKVLYGRQG
jgi:geranylgeranyl pyrophosphate synthase